MTRDLLHRLFVATNLHCHRASGGTIVRQSQDPDDRIIVIISPGCEDHNGSGRRACDNCGRWY